VEYRGRGNFQRLGEVGNQVIGVFNPDGQAHQARRNADGGKLAGVKLAVGGLGRQGRQRFVVTNINCLSI